MVICADTSFLFSLYGNDGNTPRALAWMQTCRTALTLSTLNEYELGNALRFAEFRKGIGPGEAALFWAQFEADRQVEKLREHFGGEERFRRIAQQLSAWGRANLPDAVFEALSTTSEGVMALYRMMEKGEPAVTRKADAAPATDEAGLREMMRDPRYWRTREPEFVKRVTDGFRRMVNG